MKVILLTDVKSLGKKGEVLEVADGYAQNFLIRTKKAVQATKGSMNVLEKQKQDAKDKEAKEVLEANELKEKLEKMTFEFKMKVGKEGKPFGSISTKQITEKLKDDYNITVDKRKFIDTNNIDELGMHKVKVELHKGVVATLNIKLIEE